MPKDILDFLYRLLQALVKAFADFIIGNLDRVDFGTGNLIIKATLRFLMSKLQKWLSANQKEELEKLLVY